MGQYVKNEAELRPMLYQNERTQCPSIFYFKSPSGLPFARPCSHKGEKLFAYLYVSGSSGVDGETIAVSTSSVLGQGQCRYVPFREVEFFFEEEVVVVAELKTGGLPVRAPAADERGLYPIGLIPAK